MWGPQNRSYERTRQYAGAAPIWADWQYSPEAWAAYDAAEWRRARRAAHWMLWPWLLFAVITQLLTLSNGNIDRLGLWNLMPGAMYAGIGLLIYGYLAYQANLDHTARCLGPAAMVITPLQILAGGQVIPLITADRGLLRVSIPGYGPPRIRFRGETYGSRGSQAWETEIPIPPGAEGEAEQLVGRFAQEVLRTPPQRPINVGLPSRPVAAPPAAPAAGAPTQRLPALWYGGSSLAQRYGTRRMDAPAPELSTPDHPTRRLPPRA